jgi:ketosteroid isomerase-like protein
MTIVEIADEATRAEVLAVEQRRQEALLAVDVDTLSDLYDDSIVHIHAPGLTHNKRQLLEHVATRQAYLAMTRGELTVRIIGDVAVLTGRLINQLRSPNGPDRTVGGMVTQVLRRCDDGRWRFVNFQMTPDGEHVWPATPSELENQHPQASTTKDEQQ